MKHAWILIPLLLCGWSGGAAFADDDPFAAKKKVDMAAFEEALSKKISIHFEEIDIRDALDHVARSAGVNVVVDPKVQGKVTVKMDGMRVIDALRAIGVMNGSKVHVKRGVIRVTHAEAKGEKAKKLHYFEVKDLADENTIDMARLRRAFPGAELNRHKGVLILKGEERDIKRLQEMLEKLRTERRAHGHHAEKLEKELHEHRRHMAELEQVIEKARVEIADLDAKAHSLHNAGKEDEARKLFLAQRNKINRLEEMQRKLKAAASKFVKARGAWAEVREEGMQAEKRAKLEAQEMEKRRRALEWSKVARRAGMADARKAAAEAEGLKRRIAEMLQESDELISKAEYYKRHKKHEDAAVLTKKAKAMLDEAAILQAKAREFERRGAALKADQPFKRGGAVLRRGKADVMVAGEFKYGIDKRSAAARAHLEKLKKAHAALQAAGLHKQAREVREQIAKSEAVLAQASRRHIAGGSGGGMVGEVRALRGEVQSLRREVRNLTELVKKLVEQRDRRRVDRR